MGKTISKIITKPIREFNIESRAHKVISQPKPTPAPKYKSDELSYQQMLKNQPEEFKKALEKDDGLDKRLKDVFIRSHDPMVKHESQGTTNPDRPLPTSRTYVDSGDYGFYEPKKVPLGRVTLRNVVKFISDHQSDKKTFSASKIAEQYLLPEDTTNHILKYYKMYEVYIPQERDVKAKFAGPTVARKKITVHNKLKMLDFKDKKNDK
nr:protein NDUFAF4 homolog [Onthophagus taurus]